MPPLDLFPLCDHGTGVDYLVNIFFCFTVPCISAWLLNRMNTLVVGVYERSAGCREL